MGYQLVQPARKDGERLVANAMGFKWQVPMDRGTGGAASIMTSGTQYYVLCPLYGGETVTGLAFDVGTGGSSLTLVKAGLARIDGTGLLAQSADVKASFTSTGIITAPFTSAYTPTEDGYAFAVIVAVGTTPPTLIRFNSGGTYTPAVYGANARPWGGRGGLTDISALAPSAGNVTCYWMAAY